MKAAVKVFSEKNYLDVKVADIVQEAGVAHGTFYVYFKNKKDAFEKVVSEMIDEMWENTVTRSEHKTYLEAIEVINRAYLEVFEKHVGILRNLFQVDTFNPQVAEMHR